MRRRGFVVHRLTAFSAAVLLMGAVPSIASADFRLGNNLLANDYTPGPQYGADIARDALGNFVVVWHSEGQDGSGNGIFGQRFAADGRRLGDEFAINTATAGDQRKPEVAMNAMGDFAITWVDYDESSSHVMVRAYTAQGVARGGELPVDAVGTGFQQRPDVAIDGAGDFTVIWTAPGPDAVDVFLQRFAADQTPAGDRRRVNKSVIGDQDYASIAMDPTGDFVVAWETYIEPQLSYKVYYRRFGARGLPKDDNDVSVAASSRGQEVAKVAMDASGGFVIAWCDDFYTVPTPPDHSIYVRRFGPGGAARDAEPLIVTTTPSTTSVEPGSIAMDATGDVVLTWRVRTSATSSDVLFRQLAAGSDFQNPTLRANVNTTKFHQLPSVATDADGDFVIAWDARAAESNNSNILLQRFRHKGSVNLALNQVDTPDPVGTGDALRYTLRVSNLTPPADLGLPETVEAAIGSATGVALVDTLPAGTTFVSASGTGWTCRFTAPKVHCGSRRPVLAGAVMEPVVVKVMAPSAAGSIVNQAVVSADQFDGRLTNNSDDEATGVQ